MLTYFTSPLPNIGGPPNIWYLTTSLARGREDDHLLSTGAETRHELVSVSFLHIYNASTAMLVSSFEKGDTKIYHRAKPLVVYKRRRWPFPSLASCLQAGRKRVGTGASTRLSNILGNKHYRVSKDGVHFLFGISY